MKVCYNRIRELLIDGDIKEAVSDSEENRYESKHIDC